MKKGMMIAAALAAACGLADTINVAQGDTQSVTASATITAMEVHGTLNVTGSSSSSPAALTFDPSSQQILLGSAAGDNAVINIGNYGRVGGGRFMIGGPGGAGGIVVGGTPIGSPQWNGVNAHLATGQLTLAPDATSDTGIIDILTLNAGGTAGNTQSNGRQGIVNRSKYADARVLFNGGTFYRFNGFDNFPFTTAYDTRSPDLVLQGEGGRKIILESVNGNPIRITSINGTSLWVFHGTARFRGRGDMILHSTDNTHIANWYWNQGTECWENNGDLILSGSMRLTMQSKNGLPSASTNGIVQVLGNAFSFLDLNGCDQSINGLVVSGSASLTNGSATGVSLTFGAGKPDGVLSAKKVGCVGPIMAVKQGTGTLIVTNTPYFPAMRVEKGTVHFKDGDCTLDSLSIWHGATVVVDGCTLTLNELADGENSFSCVNGGRVVEHIRSSGAENRFAADGVSAFVKAGAGTTMLYQSSSALAADVHVAGGTLALARCGTTNHWLRFSFTGMNYDSSFQLSEMLLMDAAGNRVDGGGWTVRITSGVGEGTDGSPVANAAADCAPQDMAPQSVWASDHSWILSEPSGGYRDRTPSAIFDGQSWTRLRYNSKATTESPKVFVVRVPANTAETYQYNFRTGYSGTTHPSAWKVETSPDGINWTESDSHSNVAPPSGTQAFYNYGDHYRLTCGRDGAAGLAPSANVQVDRGATLDCSRVTGGQTLANLTVDCAAGEGDGTFVNVAFAAAGTLRLVNLPAGTNLDNYELPLVFTDAAGTENVRTWTVLVDGVAIRRKATYLNGRLVFLPDGTMLILR